MQIGLWCSLCSNIAVDIVSDSGFDWLLLDYEHSPNEPSTVLTQLQAARGGTATPIVRPPWNDPVIIKRILDIGAQTLLVPHVQSVEEAARAVAATRYPPANICGVTGSGRASRYGRVPGYIGKADDEMCVLVQIETRAFMDQLDAIAAVEGADGVFIGPADLSRLLRPCRHLDRAGDPAGVEGRRHKACGHRQARWHADAEPGGCAALHRLGLPLRSGRHQCRPAAQLRG